jgi:hypothetical protein
MKITKVKMNNDGRREGTLIETYLQHLNINIGAKLSLTLEDKEYYFEVSELETSGGNLIVRARQVGYYNKIKNKKNLDLRSLIGLEVSIITDPEVINEINQESRYC